MSSVDSAMSRSDRWLERVYGRLGWRIVVAYPAVVWLVAGVAWVLMLLVLARVREFQGSDVRFISVWSALLWCIGVEISVLHAAHLGQPLRRFESGAVSAPEVWRSTAGLTQSIVKANYTIALFLSVPGGILVVVLVDGLSIELVAICLVGALSIWLYVLCFGVFLSNVILRPVLRDLSRALDGPPPAATGIPLTKRLLYVVPGLSIATATLGATVSLTPGEDLGAVLSRMLVAAVVSALVAIPVTMLFAKSVRDPIADLLEGTKRIKGADYSRPVPELSTDELGQLARSFNEAMEGLTERQRLARENISLLDEVRASRARIVAASDASRRRVERNLHDGAQQRLVALALDLRLHEENARSMSADEVKSAFNQATQDVKEALAELRELARGLHPSVLTTDGLSYALDQLAGRAKLPVTVSATTERFQPEIESAAYFVAAEALANVAKYAHASQARVIARVADDRLVVEVADDGVGGATLGSGTGLAGLADRVAALDGKLRIDSPAGQGTTVTAQIPVDGRAAVTPNFKRSEG